MRRYIRKKLKDLFKAVASVNPKLARDMRYFYLFKRRLNRKNPRTFAEKITLLQNSEQYEQLSEYADKWKVRGYVERVIGDEYNLPLLAVYDRPEDICYDDIPEGAYIKCNHGSGYNVVYRSEKKNQVIEKVNTYYHSDFYKRHEELQYKNIEKKILVEPRVAQKKGEAIWDCCFYTFNGRVDFVQIRDNKHHRFEVGRSYEKLPFRLYSTATPIQEKMPEFDQMVELAEKLAKPFQFVRVDFIAAEHRIYFCELTFSPGSGLRRFDPYEYNIIYGDKLGKVEDKGKSPANRA